jgi:hypothetical protein
MNAFIVIRPMVWGHFVLCICIAVVSGFQASVALRNGKAIEASRQDSCFHRQSSLLFLSAWEPGSIADPTGEAVM